jgi:DNA-binding transcriptional regulator YiaG
MKLVNGHDVVKLARLRELTRSGEARRIRVESDVSLRELAEPIGVSIASLSRWEHAQRRPRGEAALRYADLLERLRSAS